MHSWIKDLFPINRSITGEGARFTLGYIKNWLPGLLIKDVPTGYKAFDWEVPKEWNITDGYIEDNAGNKIVNFKENNLHVVGYSIPVDKWVDLDELNNHLYSLPDQPEAIPYVTSYYTERWGFCLPHNQRTKLKQGKYHVVINSKLENGVLNYGELVLRGKTKKEIFLSTYICHPSMANNELSGPAVLIAIGRWLQGLTDKKFTYRIIFIPETIGSLVYLSKNLAHLKRNVYAGFNMTCLGDEREYSFLPSRLGNTISDKVAKHVLKHIDPKFKEYTWLDRGSDERQYCSPGIDLPIASIMRSKYGTFPEYHTSLDDLTFVTPIGLEGGYNAVKQAIEILEKNVFYVSSVLGEPQLGKRGLYPTLSQKGSTNDIKLMMDFISFCDGKKSLLEIASLLNCPFFNLLSISNRLLKENLIRRVEIK
ncbi:MAG: DUF4910 domain-containing protein [Lewinellaceae bacterium]|nr:DUF4910 domain-containing protein [Lewinellaceae bacterium]